MHSVESGRAAHAFKAVESGYSAADKKKEYANSCKKLPMLIKINGLVPALLFAQEKKKDQFGNLEAEVLSWLRDPGCPLSQLTKAVRSPGDLTALSSQQYRQITAETQRYLGWVKRFAAARRAADKNDDDGE